MSKLPRGLALNNPCNIKTSPDHTWEGEVKPTQDPQGVLCQFTTMAEGVRAAAKLLINYHLLHDCNTIRQIITRWAPPGVDQNETEAYIWNVASWSGLTSDGPVDFTNKDSVEELVACMARQEQGHPCIDDADLTEGVARAFGITALA